MAHCVKFKQYRSDIYRWCLRTLWSEDWLYSVQDGYHCFEFFTDDAYSEFVAKTLRDENFDQVCQDGFDYLT